MRQRLTEANMDTETYISHNAQALKCHTAKLIHISVLLLNAFCVIYKCIKCRIASYITSCLVLSTL